jgi:large subunit ribosomal protein L24e
MQTTLKAMKRVQEIKSKRERVHYKNRCQIVNYRMAGKKEKELEENIKALQKNIELVEGDELKEIIMEHKLGNTVEQTDMSSTNL